MGVCVEKKNAGQKWPSDKVVIDIEGATCEVFLYGAHVTSWKVNSQERLWMSKLSAMDGTAPIRGGIPLAFPQFADCGSLSLHGFVREMVWELGEHTENSATFTLQYSGERPEFPFPFELRFLVALKPDGLMLALDATNTGGAEFSFSTCFHSYFRTPDITNLQVRGLDACRYIDKIDGRKEKTQTGELTLEGVVAESGPKGCDRIYLNPPSTLELVDTSHPALNLTITQSDSFSETVLYNPWTEGKRGASGPDFDDDGYKYMWCVEAAIAVKPIPLAAGETWRGTQSIYLPPPSK